jgi:hypothetical protein
METDELSRVMKELGIDGPEQPGQRKLDGIEVGEASSSGLENDMAEMAKDNEQTVVVEQQPAKEDRSPIYNAYPLDKTKKEIRVMEMLSPTLLEGEDITTCKIKVRFHVVSLLDRPEFCALSYVWGDPKVTRPVTVELEDGTEMVVQVTQNLEKGLRYVNFHYLRWMLADENEQENGEERQATALKHLVRFRIWADALCVNQKDLVEQGHQVGLMEDVYANAQAVFGSISETTDWTNENVSSVFADLVTLYKSATKVESYEELLTLKWISQHEVFQQNPLAFLESTPSRWGRVFTFSDHEYFNRVWIWQEICLAKHLIFVHELQALPWEVTRMIFGFLGEAHKKMTSGTLVYLPLISGSPMSAEVQSFKIIIPSSTNPEIPEHIGSARFSNLYFIADIKEERRDSDDLPPYELGRIMRWVLRSQIPHLRASNPKDYIYGMLGLTREDIEVIYDESCSLGKLYAGDFASYLVDWNNDRTLRGSVEELVLLRYSGLYMVPQDAIGDSTVAIPSWVPAYHFSTKQNRVFIPCQPSPSLNQMAELKVAEGAVIDIENLQLHVSGVEIDSIIGVEPTFGDNVEDWTLSVVIFLSLNPEIPQTSQYTRAILAFQASSLETSSYSRDPLFVDKMLIWLQVIGLLGDLILNNGRLVTNDIRWRLFKCEDGTDFVRWFSNSLVSSGEVEPRLTMLLGDLTGEDGASYDSRMAIERVSRKAIIESDYSVEFGASGRGLFVTSKGLVGSGPRCAQNGDMVVFFKGSDRPSIIRKVEGKEGESDKWLHVGPCYLPQLASGEIEGLNEVKRFTLV